MLLHFHSVEVVKRELRDSGDSDGEFAAEVGLLGFKVNGFVDLLGGEDVVADRNVVDKDTFQFIRLSAQNFIFLKSL